MTHNAFAVGAAVIYLAIVVGGAIGHSARPRAPAFAALHADDGPARVSLKMSHGTFVVPVEINGAFEMGATVDSGAADVSLPADVFYDLVNTGFVLPSDALGEATYILADGSKRREYTFMIRSLKVGKWTVENVRASVAPSHSDMLLGQSFLRAFKSWSIDNAKHELILE
jgi:clan AA aspartic protease (TIGR02281 family)